jgi:uncharacterized protein (DUF924 family)
MDAETVLTFWFIEHGTDDWFKKDPAFDEEIRVRFSDAHALALMGTLGWGTSPRSVLAEVLVLDQFSRNMFRDTPNAFIGDVCALLLAQRVVGQGGDIALTPDERYFLYMPYMHSESREVHRDALRLFTALQNPVALKYELLHKEIVDHFGRYPHRNVLLGRESTQEEVEFLKTHKGF